MGYWILSSGEVPIAGISCICKGCFIKANDVVVILQGHPRGFECAIHFFHLSWALPTNSRMFESSSGDPRFLECLRKP